VRRQCGDRAAARPHAGETDYARWLAPAAGTEALLAPIEADTLQIARA
jgi:hypothetical protein